MVVKFACPSPTTFASKGVRASESSTTRRSRGLWTVDGGLWTCRRKVRLGSSARLVLMPTRTAPARLRNLIPDARAWLLVIHFDWREAVAILQSTVIAA